MSHQEKDDIIRDRDYTRPDSDKANQIGQSSPYHGNTTDRPQDEAARSAADNDGDKPAGGTDHLKKDADEAQSDGNLSFPEGK